MISESDFIVRYEKELPSLRAWAHYVRGLINDQLSKSIGDDVSLEELIKIPVELRVKSEVSILEKAFYRNKNYKDPYSEINDKVGIRYVFLLAEEIQLVTRIIEKEKSWTFKQDRDFKKERDANPMVFDYQSMQYLVKSKKDFAYQGTHIPKGTICEVQVRTLLQHAYSELTHDLTYKPKVKAPNEIHRMVARSMALIETTDGIFAQVKKTMDAFAEEKQIYLNQLTKMYSVITSPQFDKNMNYQILDAYWGKKGFPKISLIEKFYSDGTVSKLIDSKYQTSFLYKQPVVIFVLYLVSEQPTFVKKYWPSTQDILEGLFSDAGVSFEYR